MVRVGVLALALGQLALVGCAGGSRAERANPSAEPRQPIALTYLGVARWQLDAGATTILVDPYLSRPDLEKPLVPDEAAIAARAPKRADLIVIGHSHVDHLLDAPTIAKTTGAQLLAWGARARLAWHARVASRPITSSR